MKKKKDYDLEDRLVDFAVMILDLSEKLPKTYAGNHLSKQIVRSGTAPALHYGEAQGAESKADFVHKMRIALKELRETFVCLKILYKKQYLSKEAVKKAANENNELIAIFVSSIETTKKNMKK
ncbi:MAG: four helix bundle protein [Bacteroidota bacterium]